MSEDEVEDSLSMPKKILDLGPSYFKYVLMKPTQRKISYIAAVFYNILRFTMITLILVLLPQAESITVVIDVMSSASVFTQGLKSTIPIVFYKDSLLWLTTQTTKFWPTNESTKDVDDFYKQTLRVLIFYKHLIATTFFLYVPCAFLLNKLPFPMWIPSITGGYYIIYGFQSLMLSFDVFLVLGSDSFFLAACGNIHAQFVILHDRLSNLGSTKFKRQQDLNEEVINCVHQHNFLLEYTNVLIKMYSIGLVFQFFVSTYSLCTEILILTKRDSVGMVIGVIYCSMLTFQLGLYCFPADAVIDIALECSEAVYSCPWYDHSAELKHVVINCIQRSRKPPIFTAGGFIDIDKRAFTKIFKGIMSLNTLMSSLLE